MRGEGTCSKSREDNDEYPSHCIHLRVRHRDYVCCFCGDLFEHDPPASGRHGQYRPRSRAGS